MHHTDIVSGDDLNGVDNGEDIDANALDWEDDGARHKGLAFVPYEVHNGENLVRADPDYLTDFEFIVDEVSHVLKGELFEDDN